MIIELFRCYQNTKKTSKRIWRPKTELGVDGSIYFVFYNTVIGIIFGILDKTSKECLYPTYGERFPNHFFCKLHTTLEYNRSAIDHE